MAKETTLNEIGEMLQHLVKASVDYGTKDDIAQIRAELKADIKDVGTEVASLRRDLDCLSDNVANVIGYREEIDHALERIAAIGKQLGIN